VKASATDIINMHYSQVGQDIFALQVSKRNSYIEIGAADPSKYSNTLLLEENAWTGFSIELDNKFEKEWLCKRRNKCYYQDAVNFKYQNILRYGYLSCDINPPELTLLALKNIINQGIEFDCITFEHDEYWREERAFVKTIDNATDFLTSKGYKIAVNNVFAMRRRKSWYGECHFETWYVNNDIDFNIIEYRDWAKHARIL
jgi:hypothetical protein